MASKSQGLQIKGLANQGKLCIAFVEEMSKWSHYYSHLGQHVVVGYVQNILFACTMLSYSYLGQHAAVGVVQGLEAEG